jgi:hypothetical protein
MVTCSLFLSAQNFAQMPELKTKRKYSVTFSLFIWGKMPNFEEKQICEKKPPDWHLDLNARELHFS